MPIRSCKTRPVSWQIHRNKALARAVVKMGEYYADLRKGFIIWPVWVGFLTHRDNVGFFDGSVGILRDTFFPHHPEITQEESCKARDILHDEGLIIKYQVNDINYVLVPKVNNWSRIIGNVSDKTDFPLPPAEIIKEWEQRFNEVYTPLIRCTNDVSPESKSKSKSKSKYVKAVDNFFNTPDLKWFKIMQEAYPKINLIGEFNLMRAWLISNQSKPKTNFKRFAVNWLNNPKPQIKPGLVSAPGTTDADIEKALGKIATKDMIKKFLSGVGQNDWWRVERFLNTRYPGDSGNNFIQAKRELCTEQKQNQERLGTLTAGFGRRA